MSDWVRITRLNVKVLGRVGSGRVGSGRVTVIKYGYGQTSALP